MKHSKNILLGLLVAFGISVGSSKAHAQSTFLFGEMSTALNSIYSVIYQNGVSEGTKAVLQECAYILQGHSAGYAETAATTNYIRSAIARAAGAVGQARTEISMAARVLQMGAANPYLLAVLASFGLGYGGGYLIYENSEWIQFGGLDPVYAMMMMGPQLMQSTCGAGSMYASALMGFLGIFGIGDC